MTDTHGQRDCHIDQSKSDKEECHMISPICGNFKKGVGYK